VQKHSTAPDVVVRRQQVGAAASRRELGRESSAPRPAGGYGVRLWVAPRNATCLTHGRSAIAGE
jgi:hypothetical protein